MSDDKADDEADDPIWFWGTEALRHLPSGVDPTQIAENLKLTPTERIEKMQRFQRFLEEAKRSRGDRPQGSD
jgi:hypothetical protein